MKMFKGNGQFVRVVLLFCICIKCYGQSDASQELSEYNLISDLFLGGGKLIDLELSLPPQLNSGEVRDGFDTEKNRIHRKKVFDSLFDKAIRFEGENGKGLFLSDVGPNILKSGEYIFYCRFPSEYIESVNFTFGFWLNLKQLNGNGIVFKATNAQDYVLSNANLSKVGSKAYRSNVPANKWLFEITKVKGDYVFLKFNPKKGQFSFSFYNYEENGGKSVPFLDVINPIFLDGIKEINPNLNYKSEAEFLNSNKIGKLAFIIGDSQYQDRIAHRIIARKTGLNVISMAKGGHSIKYKNVNKDRENFYWFYNINILQKLILQEKGVDYYILPLSTNDGAGGGTLDNNTIQKVIDNYPYIQDNEIEIKRKLDSFNTMGGEEKESVFGFKQTFAAMVNQLQEINPEAKFLFTSIPISPIYFKGLKDSNGNGVWKDGWNSQKAKKEIMPQYNKIRKDSKELANWFNANWVDLKNKVDLTFENATFYSIDGIHWSKDIKVNTGNCLAKELNKI